MERIVPFHLHTATSLCETLGEKVPNLKDMMTEIEVVEWNLQDGAFFSFVTTEERRAVFAAVKKEDQEWELYPIESGSWVSIYIVKISC